MMLALLLSFALANPQPNDPPAVRVQLNHDQFRSGDNARVYVETARDGYLIVLHADPQGRVRVLFPLDPSDDDFVRGGRRQELRGRSDRDAFQVDDDDGSGTVAVLEIAEALVSAPVKPKRSILFIWHAGEEEGLWGSEYFTDHPTVPRDSIVTELNIDMIGRGRADDVKGGGPGYVQLIGSRRLSTELGDLVESVAKTEPMPFKFDYQYDANGHPQQYYCRSDHYEYARYGIPIVFFSTGGHRDYHQVTDEPQYIDYDQLARVSSLVRDVAIRAANIDHRLVVDKHKPDPHGQCVQ